MRSLRPGSGGGGGGGASTKGSNSSIVYESLFLLGLPSVITLSSHVKSDDQGRPCTVDGIDYNEALRRLKDAGADVVGFNCTRGPEEMLKLVESAINAGIEVSSLYEDY